VGKTAPPAHFAACFPNSPSIHNPDLEILLPPQPAPLQPFRLDSHFSSRPTETTVFFKERTTHKSTRRIASGPRVVFIPYALPHIRPEIQESAHVFHAREICGVNTIKGNKTQPFPQRRKVIE
jgi:hypothetical protein